jgi:hypothetical protein
VIPLVLIETLHLWWRPRRGSIDTGGLFEIISSFLSRDKKAKQKKTPVPRLTLRVAVAAGARGNSSAL